MSNNTNLFQSQQTQKKRPVVPNHDSILEAFRDLGSGVGKNVTDMGKGVASDAFNSLLNPFQPPTETRGKNPFEMPFPFKRPEAPKPQHTPEILQPHRIAEERERVRQEIEAVRMELQALAKSMGNLNSEIQKAIMEVPVDPGVYHLNFFDRIKRALKLLRESVEDSRSWLALSGGKKKQKGYWGKYKKHGTQFGLSSERTVATQTG